MTEQIKDFRLPASTGHTLEFEAFRGKLPLVLVFVPDTSASDGERLLTELDKQLKDFGAERSQVLVVVNETARQVRELADSRELAVPLLADASGSMARDFEVGDRVVAVVADKTGNIERRFDPLDPTDPEMAVETLLETVRRIGEPPRA